MEAYVREASPATRNEVTEVKEADAPDAVQADIRQRWSPRSFADRPLTGEQVGVLLEAARWAPSSYNEQPWRFIVAMRENRREFERLLRCFNEENRAWAKDAPVIMLSAARTRFSESGRENRHAYHDVGLAVANLTIQATSMDLYVHQMAGIDPELARDTYEVPDDYDVVAGLAIGYLGDPMELSDPKRRRAETRERSRKPLEDLVFAGSWGKSAELTRSSAA